MPAVALRAVSGRTPSQPRILAEYESSMRQSGKGSTSVIGHLRVLRQFARHCGTSLELATPEHVVPYVRTIDQAGISKQTRNLHIQSLQLFFLWRDRPVGRTVPNLHHLIGARKSDRTADLPSIVLDWLTDLEGENRARNTCLAYVHDITRFGEFNKGRGIKGARGPDLMRYLRHLTKSGVSHATRARKITVLRVFYEWYARQQGRARSIGDYLKPPRRPQTLHHWWQPDQVAQFRTAFQGDDEVVRRDRALCELLLLGLRVSEAVNLDVDHVIDLPHPDRAGIRITRKGPKEQFIPLNADARTALQRWLEVRPDMPTPAVFFRIPFQPGRNLERLHYASAEKIFKAYAAAAGVPVPYGVACHLLRHTAAQRLANLGVPLQDIQTLLGHEDPATTMIYFRVADTNLRRTVQKLSYDEEPTVQV